MIRIKRAYETPEEADGLRFLVDRLWPRGLTKEKARIDGWLKELAPSAPLRKWFAHREERWEEFRRRYFAELRERSDLVDDLRRRSRRGGVTLIYAAKDEERNNAAVILEFLRGDG
jgi:uncharacterized protein YeaO (DUF488 family)